MFFWPIHIDAILDETVCFRFLTCSNKTLWLLEAQIPIYGLMIFVLHAMPRIRRIFNISKEGFQL